MGSLDAFIKDLPIDYLPAPDAFICKDVCNENRSLFILFEIGRVKTLKKITRT